MKKTKIQDLAPKSGAKVTGTRPPPGDRDGTNDSLTLVRAVKPAPKAKDLPPKKVTKVTGGRPPRGDLVGYNDNLTLVRAATTTPNKKNLRARQPVKGGRWKNA